ncbi:MAG: TlpA disulfide reductase family protein [Motiliproteus sp.]
MNTNYMRTTNISRHPLPGLWSHIWAILSLMLLLTSPLQAETFKGHSTSFAYTDPTSSAPLASFVDMNGNPQRISDYQGQVVLVNLWASWCAACIYEMPELDALQQELGQQGLTVLTLNQDLTDGKQALAFLRQQGIKNLTGHLDPNFKFGHAYNQKLLPMTLLFDTNGKQIGHLVGVAAWNSSEAKALIRQYLPTGKSETHTKRLKNNQA